MTIYIPNCCDQTHEAANQPSILGEWPVNAHKKEKKVWITPLNKRVKQRRSESQRAPN